MFWAVSLETRFRSTFWPWLCSFRSFLPSGTLLFPKDGRCRARSFPVAAVGCYTCQQEQSTRLIAGGTPRWSSNCVDRTAHCLCVSWYVHYPADKGWSCNLQYFEWNCILSRRRTSRWRFALRSPPFGEWSLHSRGYYRCSRTPERDRFCLQSALATANRCFWPLFLAFWRKGR